jgi:CubicO group peptidase (beta-lactamase class C family)
MDLEMRLADLVAGYDARPDTGPVRLHLETPGWRWSYGADQPYFLASITKLVTAALIMQLADSRELTLDQPVVELLPVGAMTGLHARRGADRSERITVRHLLAHTSGLPDYFEDKRADGGTTIARVFEHDTAWTKQDLLAITRGMRPRFAPGAARKAHYSDTNYQLLGAIIEHLTGVPYAAAVNERVTVPLALRSTYVFGPDTLTRYDDIDPMLNGKVRLHIPQAMASFQADGGLVSTAAESARFLRAFFAGELFDPTHLAHMQATWRRIFYPLRYGEGLMLFVLPRVLTGFRAVPRLIGHSGASGSVLFRAADVDLVISGTVNQIAKRDTAFQLMTRAVLEVGKSA